MIWSHCGFQGVPPSSTFFSSMGVGGADLVACACEAVAIPMKNTRLTMNDVFSAGKLMFTSVRHQSTSYTAPNPRPAGAALGVMPSCGVSLPSFSRRVAFSELLRHLFPLWLRLQPEMAIPAWAVSQCDGGHGAAAGCVQLLRPTAAQCHYVFGARPQGTSESFQLSWPKCGRTISVQAVQFWPPALGEPLAESCYANNPSCNAMVR